MSLKQMLDESYFHSYAYSYPHKMAYRELDEKVSLKDAWKDENKEALFLYLHIPFCEMRCGFCNLFTMTLPEKSIVEAYLDQLEKEAEKSFEDLNSPSFSRIAVGGGTPSFLNEEELNRFFGILSDSLKVNRVPFSFETSPTTLSKDKLQMLKEKGVSRISMGIQSVIDQETKNLGRPQKISEVENTVRLIKESQIDIMNLDLIYGAKGQSVNSWKQSINYVIEAEAEEVFLYPLYVRPLTGLGKRKREEEDFRLELYRTGRDLLLESGYEQVSMRMFRKYPEGLAKGPIYRCQEDGMLGLGAGARSYTKELHYSSEYAVGRSGIKEIINNYSSLNSQELLTVNYGTYLNTDEQMRRYVIKSILHEEGLNKERFKSIYNTDPFTYLPQLQELVDLQMMIDKGGLLSLNQIGMEASDAIGPWLYSDAIMEQIRKFELK